MSVKIVLYDGHCSFIDIAFEISIMSTASSNVNRQLTIKGRQFYEVAVILARVSFRHKCPQFISDTIIQSSPQSSRKTAAWHATRSTSNTVIHSSSNNARSPTETSRIFIDPIL